MYLTLNDRVSETPSNVRILDDHNSKYDVEDMLSTSFSEAFVSGGVDPTFEIQVQDFSNSLDYVAIAGHDSFGKVSSIDFYTTDGSGAVFSLDKSYTPTSNETIVHVFSTARPKYKIVFNKINASDKITLSRLMAGDIWQLPRGGFERSGYRYLTTTVQLEQRVQMARGIPTASLYRNKALKGSVSMPDLETSEINLYWNEFQQSAFFRGFMYLEDTDRGDEAVYCYNVKPNATTAHDSTLNLRGVSLSFDAWTGRNV